MSEIIMMINGSTKKSIQLILLLSLALLLGSCQNNADSTCNGIVETAGEPDLTASPTFALPTVAPGGTINVDISIDAETLAGTVLLLPTGSQDVATQVATSPIVPLVGGAAETVTVSLTVDGAAAVKTYYPVVVLCDPSVATCTKGAGYVEDISGLLADTGNYVRGTAKNDGTVDLSSLIDSCVPITTVNVN